MSGVKTLWDGMWFYFIVHVYIPVTCGDYVHFCGQSGHYSLHNASVTDTRSTSMLGAIQRTVL